MNNNLNLKVTTNMDKATNSMKKFKNALSGTGTAFNGANKNLNRLQGSFRNLNADANRSTTAIKGFGKSLGGVNFLANIYMINRLAMGFAKCVNSTMDMIEVTNLFNVAMGTMATETNRALVELSELSGLDLTNLQQAVGTYNLLARSMGFSAQQASILSMNTTKLALDLSSLTNIPFEQAMADLKSGLIGQTETVYKYGIDLTEATLKQEAMNLGIDKSVRNMGQGEKMALRYSVMIRQTALAQGDFANTIEQPANQLRLLKENFVTLARSIGSVFIPVLSRVLPYLRAIVMVLSELFSMLASVLGFMKPTIEDTGGSLGSVSEDIDNVGDSADKTAKKLKQLQAPFDELNTLNTDSSSGDGALSGMGVDGLSEEMLATLREYDNLMGNVKQKANEIRDRLLDWLGITKELNAETGEIQYGIKEGSLLESLQNAINNEDWYEFGRLIGERLGLVLSDLDKLISWENVQSGVEKFTTQMGDMINGFFEGMNWIQLGKTMATGINTAFKATTTAIKKINWSSIGKSFGETFNGFFKNLDAESIAETFYTTINSAIDLALGFLNEADLTILVGKLTTFINELFKNTDWVGLGETVGKFIVDLIDGAFQFIISLDYNSIIQSIADVITGIFKGAIKGINNSVIGKVLKDAFWNIFSWKTTESMFQNAIDSFKSGMEALCRLDMPEVGKYIIDGILEGLAGAVMFILEPIANIFKTFYDAFCEVFGIHSPADEMIPIGEFIIKGILEGFLNTINDTYNTVVNWCDSVKKYFTELVPNIISTVVAFFTELPSKIKEKIDNIKKTIEDWVEDCKGWVNEFVPKICNAIIDIFNKLPSTMFNIGKNILKGIWNGICSMGSWLMDKIAGFFGGIGEDIVEGLGIGRGSEETISPVPHLARGGMLQNGIPFVAGENGKSELVGSHKGQTTVMPLENSGFVSAMYDAVYSAVAGAMGEGGNGGGIIENVLMLDGETIYRNQQKVASNKGLSLGNINFQRG